MLNNAGCGSLLTGGATSFKVIKLRLSAVFFSVKMAEASWFALYFGQQDCMFSVEDMAI
jgi:hypothetical protein